MNLRLSSNHRSGSCQIHRGRKKKLVKFAAMSSSCWSFFPTSKALSTRNSYPLVKPSLASFTVRIWSVCGRSFCANVQINGRTITGFSTITMRPLTHHSLFENSWLPKILQSFPTPTSRLTSPLGFFFLFPKMKLRLKGIVLTRMRRSKHNRKRSLILSRLRTSSDAWNHGKHAGTAVYMPKGTTSKETVETRSYGKKVF